MGNTRRNKQKAKRHQADKRKLLKSLGMNNKQQLKSTQGDSSNLFGLTKGGKLKSTRSTKKSFRF